MKFLEICVIRIFLVGVGVVAANFDQVRLFPQDSSENARYLIREVFVFLTGDK